MYAKEAILKVLNKAEVNPGASNPAAISMSKGHWASHARLNVSACGQSS